MRRMSIYTAAKDPLQLGQGESPKMLPDRLIDISQNLFIYEITRILCPFSS